MHGSDVEQSQKCGWRMLNVRCLGLVRCPYRHGEGWFRHTNSRDLKWLQWRSNWSEMLGLIATAVQIVDVFTAWKCLEIILKMILAVSIGHFSMLLENTCAQLQAALQRHCLFKWRITITAGTLYCCSLQNPRLSSQSHKEEELKDLKVGRKKHRTWMPWTFSIFWRLENVWSCAIGWGGFWRPSFCPCESQPGPLCLLHSASKYFSSGEGEKIKWCC